MGMIYTPAKEHRCNPPDRNGMRDSIGAVWRCDECGTYLHFTYTDDSWGPVWTPVRWWNFRARKRIKQGLDGQRSFPLVHLT